MNDNTMKELGIRLKELRDERELTLDMVVYDIDQKYHIEINKGNLSRWESGKRIPTLRFAAYLCMYYNVSLDYLMGLTDCKTPSDLLAKKNKKTQEPEKG